MLLVRIALALALLFCNFKLADILEKSSGVRGILLLTAAELIIVVMGFVQ